LSEFLYSEDIESFCSQIRREVTLTVTASKPSTATITGKPTECNHYGTEMMQHTHEPWVTCNQSAQCLLKAAKITTGRKRK
jgi:hypothetical protein